MPCSLRNRVQVRSLVFDVLEVITDGHHDSISEKTKLDGGAQGLGFDPTAVRGWCGMFRGRVAQRGCPFSLTPNDFESFKTVGDIVGAVCKEVGL